MVIEKINVLFIFDVNYTKNLILIKFIAMYLLITEKFYFEK